MMTTAEILEAPEARDVGDGLTVRVAKVALAPAGFALWARIQDPPGVSYPYAKGDRVRVIVADGGAAAGVFIVGRFASPPTAGAGDIVQEARGEGSAHVRATSPGGVYLGEGDTGDQVAIALADETAADSASLQAQIDVLAGLLDALVAPGIVTAAMQSAVPGYVVRGVPLVPPENHVIAPNAKPAANVFAKPEA